MTWARCGQRHFLSPAERNIPASSRRSWRSPSQWDGGVHVVPGRRRDVGGAEQTLDDLFRTVQDGLINRLSRWVYVMHSVLVEGAPPWCCLNWRRQGGRDFLRLFGVEQVLSSHGA